MVVAMDAMAVAIHIKYALNLNCQLILTGGSQNFEIWSRDLGHAHLGVVLWSGRSRGPSSMTVPNLKWMALFVQKLLGGPKISKFGHVT